MIKKFNKFNIYELTYLKLIGLLELCWSLFKKQKKSGDKLDVIISLHEKDIEILEYCILGIRKNLMHEISQIFIISKDTAKTRKKIERLNCSFVDENSLIDLKKENINYVYKNIDRSGWLFQQFLNYAGVVKLGMSEYKFCINADTILSKKQTFLKNNKIVFNACDDYHFDYFDAAEKILGIKNFSKFSFTSHHMLYRRSIMESMHKIIEKRFKEKWYYAIYNNVNKNLHACHSDFETYAQFVFNYHRNSMKIEYWFNKTIFKDKSISNYFNQFILKSISFHSWAKDL